MLMRALEEALFQKGAPRAIRHIARPDIAALARQDPDLLRQIRVEFQLAPPLTLHASAVELLAGYWHALREAYVVGRRERALRELVASTVSSLNACPYCVTVHSGMFAASGAGDIGADSAFSPEMRAVRDWAAATLSPGSDALARPDFARSSRAQLFATAAMFHYTNRMVSLFLDDSPVPLPAMASPRGRRLAQRALAFMSKRIARHEAAPGAVALPEGASTDAVLPEAFAWARESPHVATALAHFARTAEAAGQEALPDAVREAITAHLATWRGAPVPLGRGWLEDAVAPLAEGHRPAARLALLTARAPWQIDQGLIAAFRATAPTDRQLVQTAGWAAYAATRQIAGWFPTEG